jgi:fructokinase
MDFNFLCYKWILVAPEPCFPLHNLNPYIFLFVFSYDPNLRLPLWPSAEAARKGIMSIWDQADIIKV